MARVKITATYEPEAHEVDESDPTGLTAEAFEELMGGLIGFDDVEIEKADD